MWELAVGGLAVGEHPAREPQESGGVALEELLGSARVAAADPGIDQRQVGAGSARGRADRGQLAGQRGGLENDLDQA